MANQDKLEKRLRKAEAKQQESMDALADALTDATVAVRKIDSGDLLARGQAAESLRKSQAAYLTQVSRGAQIAEERRAWEQARRTA